MLKTLMIGVADVPVVTRTSVGMVIISSVIIRSLSRDGSSRSRDDRKLKLKPKSDDGGRTACDSSAKMRFALSVHIRVLRGPSD